MNKYKLIIPFFILAASAAMAAGAPDLSSLEPGNYINTDKNGIAIDGYDVVAYFTDGAPALGLSEYSFKWRGAEWRFASERHLTLFSENPEAYAPQYGGYCAWGVLENQAVEIDPAAWTIVDGMLYLNYNLRIHARWEEDIEGNIEEGDTIWFNATTF